MRKPQRCKIRQKNNAQRFNQPIQKPLQKGFDDKGGGWERNLPWAQKKFQGGIEMEIEIVKKVEIPDGIKTGSIASVGYRTTEEGYKYVDVFINPEGYENVVLKYSAPQNTSQDSKLCRLLQQFADVSVGQKIDIEKTLVGKRVSFMTLQ